jgi:deoxycytidine triphosphate deaminase
MILAKNEICSRLLTADSNQQIFLPGSWEIGRVRGAAYDLRVAADFLITPQGTRYWPEAREGFRERRAAFVLKPGEVAFVSSQERLCMPWDLAGNVAPKFRYALDGILIMGGLLVDPGYGRVVDGDGSWVPSAEGARLHFQLANIGTDELRIIPGETSVAALQLIELTGNPRLRLRQGEQGQLEEDEDVDVPSSEQLLHNLFHAGASEPLEPLEFFSSTASLKDDLEAMRRDLANVKIRFKENERSTDRLVVFGVFLVAITLFSAAIAAIISVLGDGNGGADFGTGSLAVGLILLAIVGVAAWKIMRPVVRVLERDG